MDTKKKIEAYNTLITALGTFKQGLLESAENLDKSAKMCEDIMGSDKPSMEAAARVSKAVMSYRNITLEVKQLQDALGSDRDELIDIMNMMNEEE